MNGNFDEGLKYAAELQKSNNNEHLSFAYGAGSYLYQLKGNRAKCDEWYNKALSYYKKLPESVQKINLRAYLYNYRGLTEWKRKNFSNALSNYQEGIKLSIKTSDVIQTVKFKSNIALVNEEVGNYELAIKNLRQNSDFLDKNESLYEKDQFQNSKSNIYTNLGNVYEGYFIKDRKKLFLLDSAEYFYKRAITYSQNYIDNKMTATLSLGNIYLLKRDYKNAERAYFDISIYAKQNNDETYYKIANHNLGDLYYNQKNMIRL